MWKAPVCIAIGHLLTQEKRDSQLFTDSKERFVLNNQINVRVEWKMQVISCGNGDTDGVLWKVGIQLWSH